MITEEIVLAIAKKYATDHGWHWLEPVKISRKNHWYGPLYSYCIITNSKGTGLNIRLEIEAKTGKVLKGQFIPR